MNGKMLFGAMRNIDVQLILDAAPDQKNHPSRAWVRWGALAACLCLVVAVIFGVAVWLHSGEADSPNSPNGPNSILPHKHAFGQWQVVKTATCSEKGEQVRVCSCGEKETQITALLPHFAGEWVVEKEPTIKLPTPGDPVEREPGLKCQFCERCGAKLDEELIPATGSLGLAYAVNPDGKTFSVAGVGNCTDEDIIIPENFCGYHVTAVGKNAFYGCEQIKSITLPKTITVIDEYAFSYCKSLESITLPEGLVEIGAGAFYSCRILKEIVVPSGVTKIGARAFADIFYLEKVVLPGGLDCIEEGLFESDYHLKSVTLPQGIASIGNYAFSYCSALRSINIPESVTSIGGRAFSQCSSITSIVLPEGITTIQWGTFEYCSALVSITIPSSVTSIGSSAFERCRSLTDIHIPQGVTQIGSRAFLECYSLTRITLPEGLVGIESNTFYYCSKLSEINIPDSVTYIDSNAFYACKKLVQVEDNVTYVDNCAISFQHGVIDVALREDTVGIASAAFETPGVLERLTIPNSVKHIGERVVCSTDRLKEIVFDGTEEEWDAIHKEEGWDTYLYDTEIVFKESGTNP